MHLGDGPLVATAIHDGHAIRPELAPYVALAAADRLREEDPFTAQWTHIAATQVIGTRSRFEVDLNRPRDKAVYLLPEDAWGLQVWRESPPAPEIQQSLALYDDFYRTLRALYDQKQREYGRFVVFDLHSYNHRRSGPQGPPAEPQGNPQVNIGTGTLRDRAPFASLIDRFMHDLASYPFPGGQLDVRENVKFLGGQHPRWTHEYYAGTGCVLAIEFKKFFMDEWTGEADESLVSAIHDALASTVPGILDELGRLG
jgi:hypothetical protein